MTDSTPLVCVVDDDASVLKGLARLLRAWCYRVRTCTGAQEFLDQSGDKSIDCVVVDMHMPGLSGLELQAALHRSGRRVPVVFVTGHGDAATRDRALAAGASAFLQKPFTDRELIQEVETAIQRRAAEL
jgi:FixJ family two-component response regulator